MASTDPNRPVTGYPAQNGATAYPYPPPANYQSYPYPPQQPNYYYDQHAARRATWLRRIFAFVIACVVIFGTVTFIVWLVLRPQVPRFRVDDLRISNFTVNPNSTSVTLTSQVQLTARNPNKKMTLKYGAFDAYLYYGSTSLAETVIPPFAQGTKNETALSAAFAAVGTYVGGGVVRAINDERSRNGNSVATFNLRMLCKVKFEAKAWRTRRRYLKVFCGKLKVGFSGGNGGRSGSLTGGPSQCQVGI